MPRRTSGGETGPHSTHRCDAPARSPRQSVLPVQTVQTEMVPGRRPRQPASGAELARLVFATAFSERTTSTLVENCQIPSPDAVHVLAPHLKSEPDPPAGTGK